MKSKAICTVIIAVVFCLFPISSNAEEIQRTVTTTGTITTRVSPDVIVWHIGIKDTDKSVLVNAKKRNDEKVRRVLKLIRSLEVSPEDLQTGTLDVRREYEYDSRGRNPEFKEFVIERGITFKQRNLIRFDEFFDKLIGAGDIEASFSFESTRFHELRKETRLKAVRTAKEKAKAMCREAGAKLGKPITISEVPQNAPSYASRNTHGYYSSLSNNISSASINTEAEIDTTIGSFAPGAIEIKVSVHAVFEIT